MHGLYGPQREKTYLQGLQTTKAQKNLCIGAVWSEFVIPLLERIMSRLAMSEI